MDPIFREIYREQVELYRGFQVGAAPWWADIEHKNLQALSIASEAIDEAMSVLPEGVSLRADARLFLLINLHQIVTIPLTDRRSPTEFSREVENGIKADVKKILKASMEHASNRRQIAASHMIWGLATVLEKLSLKAWRLWETDE